MSGCTHPMALAKVISSRIHEPSNVRVRERACTRCGARFLTAETATLDQVMLEGLMDELTSAANRRSYQRRRSSQP